jgi:CHAD domain-containing protein
LILKRQVRVASYGLHPGDTLAEAARKIILKQVARMRKHAPGTREGRDCEALHDMRVATRRLRFALRLFAPWMPPGRADRLRTDLRRVALALGRVRDLDVFLEGLPSLADEAGLSADQRRALLGALRRRRGQGRSVLVRMLAGRRFLALVLVLERVPLSGADAPAREASGRMLRKAARALRAWGRRADLTRPADLHRLRILFKRLRYTCEYFNELYGGALDGAIARFIRFQDCLGRYQDAVIAASLLDGLPGSRKPEDGGDAGRDRDRPDLAGATAKIQEILRAERGLQREAFAELWVDFPLLMRAFTKLQGLPERPGTESVPSGTDPEGRNP